MTATIKVSDVIVVADVSSKGNPMLRLEGTINGQRRSYGMSREGMALLLNANMADVFRVSRELFGTLVCGDTPSVHVDKGADPRSELPKPLTATKAQLPPSAEASSTLPLPNQAKAPLPSPAEAKATLPLPTQAKGATPAPSRGSPTYGKDTPEREVTTDKSTYHLFGGTWYQVRHCGGKDHYRKATPLEIAKIEATLNPPAKPEPTALKLPAPMQAPTRKLVTVSVGSNDRYYLIFSDNTCTEVDQATAQASLAELATA